MRRPVDTRTKEPIEPAHNFEVALEPDNFTDEKCEMPLIRLAYAVLILYRTDTHSLQIIRKRSIMKALLIFREVVSSASSALAYIAILLFNMAKKSRSAPITSATV